MCVRATWYGIHTQERRGEIENSVIGKIDKHQVKPMIKVVDYSRRPRYLGWKTEQKKHNFSLLPDQVDKGVFRSVGNGTLIYQMDSALVTYARALRHRMVLS